MGHNCGLTVLKADINGLEIAHQQCLKQVATLSPYCNTTFTLVSLDMDSAEELIDFYKLKFPGQLFRLSPQLLAKQIFVHNLIRHITYGDVMLGYIPDIYRLAMKYMYKIGHLIQT